MSIHLIRGPRGPYKKTYKKSDILLALSDHRSAVRAGRKMTFAAAGRPYGIPSTTVRDAHRKTTIVIASAPRHSIPDEVLAAVVSASRAGSHMLLLTSDVEQKLLDYIESCKALAHPLTIDTVRHKAKRLYFATHNTPITAQNMHDMASRQWWNRFKKRHPTLSLRAPQLLALQRARATQPEIINHFYDLLKLVYDTYQLQPHQIWAMDETGVDNNFKVRKVVANKGWYKHTQREDEASYGCVCVCIDMLYFYYLYCRRRTCASSRF